MSIFSTYSRSLAIVLLMATKPKPTANAEANVPSKRTVKVVTMQEAWDAIAERNSLTNEFCHLVIEFDHIAREARVSGRPDWYDAQYEANAKARKRVKARIAKVQTLIRRWERQNKASA